MSDVVAAAHQAMQPCPYTPSFSSERISPVGPVGVVAVELFKSKLAREDTQRNFVFELRVFVVGGLMYGAMYSHSENAHSGSGPRYYIFPDGASGWVGCQHSALRADHAACVAYLRRNKPQALPDTDADAMWINKVAQARLEELRHESERVTRELGASFFRVDWFVDDDVLSLNEMSCKSKDLSFGFYADVSMALYGGTVTALRHVLVSSHVSPTCPHSSIMCHAPANGRRKRIGATREVGAHVSRPVCRPHLAPTTA